MDLECSKSLTLVYLTVIYKPVEGRGERGCLAVFLFLDWFKVIHIPGVGTESREHRVGERMIEVTTLLGNALLLSIKDVLLLV